MNKKQVYMGVDVGSVSINVVLVDSNNELVEKVYVRTQGKPIQILKKTVENIYKSVSGSIEVKGVGVTGSGRELAGAILGADVIKNEITAHGIAALTYIPDAKTILEIGGQDSKIILLRNRVISDFAMNTVCAAGTGSFLDRQASRLEIPIDMFGDLALKAKSSVRIAGRCAVFAESDMIHKQQLGCKCEDIIKGLCEALVRNYLSNVGKGKEILPSIVFQGGVAANKGIKKAFEDALGYEVIVPEHYDVMGALGAALLAKNEILNGKRTIFKGFNVLNDDFAVNSFECSSCSNCCEIVEILSNKRVVARFGDRCGKWAGIESNNSKITSMA